MCDEAIFDYVGTAIIRRNYYYCQRMGNTSPGRASVTHTFLAHAGSKCSPKDHFHSNLIFSWSFFDYQSWNIKYRLEPERCWKLKFTGGAHLCPWETATMLSRCDSSKAERSQAASSPGRGERGMLGIPPAFCWLYLYYINLVANPNRPLVVDVAKCSLYWKNEERLLCQGRESFKACNWFSTVSNCDKTEA